MPKTPQVEAIPGTAPLGFIHPQVRIAQALAIRAGLMSLLRGGPRLNTLYTPKNLVRTAATITDSPTLKGTKSYGRIAMTLAVLELSRWIDAQHIPLASKEHT
jgi:hypothetical protein